MVANQSKHTVHFSDLSWQQEDPQFPRAWMVGRYLTKYAERYLQAADIRIGYRVVATELAEGHQWRVKALNGAQETEQTYDYLLITTGFFGRPLIPTDIVTDSSVPIIHSSKYRDLQGLLGQGTAGGGKILVVGGQMSGVEIADTISTHLSSAISSPGQPPISNPERYSVHHVIQRPIWVIPLHTCAQVRIQPPHSFCQ
jgi:cation diffusion facilitator CzcD-associated flavoprotein CzcO